MVTLNAVKIVSCNYDYIENTIAITFTIINNSNIYQAISKWFPNEEEEEGFDLEYKFRVNSFTAFKVTIITLSFI